MKRREHKIIQEKFEKVHEYFDVVQRCASVKKHLFTDKIRLVHDAFGVEPCFYEVFPEELCEKLRPIIAEYYAQAAERAQKNFADAVNDLAMSVPEGW